MAWNQPVRVDAYWRSKAAGVEQPAAADVVPPPPEPVPEPEPEPVLEPPVVVSDGPLEAVPAHPSSVVMCVDGVTYRVVDPNAMSGLAGVLATWVERQRSALGG